MGKLGVSSVCERAVCLSNIYPSVPTDVKNAKNGPGPFRELENRYLEFEGRSLES